MGYSLFIDDERFPPNDGKNWVVARSLEEVKNYIELWGMPSYISFDHDLGDGQPTGHDIVKFLIQTDQDTEIRERQFQPTFDFYVHSQNPIGAQNIRNLLTAYLRYRFLM